MFATLESQNYGPAVVSWHKSVQMPRFVPLTAQPEGHVVLSARYSEVVAVAEESRVGTAVRVRHWGGKTVYWMRRRAHWSADARRVDGRLRLICFLRLDPGPLIGHLPGFPIGGPRK